MLEFALGELEMKSNHQLATAVVFIVLGPWWAVEATAGDLPNDQSLPRAVATRRAAAAKDARSLSAAIDRLLAARWADAKVQCAPPADDAEYLRRVYLDLVGNIPTAALARDFLDDSSPDK